MSTAENLETSGSTEIRVDCNCSRYSRETVTIPHSVVMDALVEEPSVEALLADPRISATKIDSQEPRPPSADFKIVHLMQVASTMRNRKLIPFSPFVRNIEFLKEQEAYAAWVVKYFAQLPPDSVLSAPEPAPVIEVTTDENLGTTMVVTSEISFTEPVTESVPAALAEPEPDPDPFASYPEPPTAKQVVDWIGEDPARAQYALDQEALLERVRVTVTRHAASVLD